MTYYVYKITNLINNKIYIGKTANSNPNNRWAQHLRVAKNKTTSSHQYQLIHKSINKYGVENFTFEIIEVCESEDLSLAREIFWIAEYKSNVYKNGNDFGYNLTDGGDGSSGFKHSQESKDKMSAIRKGTRKGIENSFFGKNHSDETKKTISLKSKGRQLLLSDIEKRSKMNRESVLELRKKYEEGYSIKGLAEEFNISYEQARSIAKYIKWKSI